MLEEARALLEGLQAEVPAAGGQVHRVVDPRSASIVHLVLDHPAARNALSVEMMRQLAEHVEALIADPAVAGVVLRSAEPGMFCAGGNLKQVRGGLGTPDRGQRMVRAMSAVLDALWSAPILSVAAVGGPAVGGGAELAFATDDRLVGPDGWVAFRQVRLGVAAGWGGARRLRLAAGRTHALRWMGQGRRLEGEQLQAAGVGQAVEDLERAVTAWVERIASSPVAAVRAVKQQVISQDLGGTPTEVVGRASAAFGGVWGSASHGGRAVVDG